MEIATTLEKCPCLAMTAIMIINEISYIGDLSMLLIVASARKIILKVWGHDYFGEIRVVDVHLGHVRQKLGEHHHITTVRGVGYRFEKGE